MTAHDIYFACKNLSSAGNASTASLGAAGMFLPDYTQLRQLLVTLNTVLYFILMEFNARFDQLPSQKNKTKKIEQSSYMNIDAWKMKNEKIIKTKFTLQPKTLEVLPARSRK